MEDNNQVQNFIHGFVENWKIFLSSLVISVIIGLVVYKFSLYEGIMSVQVGQVGPVIDGLERQVGGVEHPLGVGCQGTADRRHGTARPRQRRVVHRRQVRHQERPSQQDDRRGGRSAQPGERHGRDIPAQNGREVHDHAVRSRGMGLMIHYHLMRADGAFAAWRDIAERVDRPLRARGHRP